MFAYPRVGNRDGTSQHQRRLQALQPDYVQLDERSTADLLAFARAYARELVYFNNDMQRDGDWQAFMGSLEPDDVMAFLANPDDFNGPRGEDLRRPHFVLFLTFLKLLQHGQGALNSIGKRHLDFYFRQILGVTRQGATPDRLHVILQPGPRVKEVEVPGGSVIDAGKDSLGRKRSYRTDRPILVNRARVDRLMATFAQRRTTGIRDALESPSGTFQERVIAMFSVALGSPLPGDELPGYAGGDAPAYRDLETLADLLDFALGGLGLKLSELREIIKFKTSRENAEDDWHLINTALQQVARTRTGDPAFTFSPADPRDFDTNLTTVLVGAPNYDGLPEVEYIDDVYVHRMRADVQTFIRDSLHFADFQQFVDMMTSKIENDSEWAGINQLLETGGKIRRDNPGYRFPAPGSESTFEPTAFETNLAEALQNPDFGSVGASTIDTYYAALLTLEDYFFMSAENFAFIMSVVTGNSDETPDSAWPKVYDLLGAAYREKIYRGWRGSLQTVRESNGFDAMLRLALGENPTNGLADPLSRLRRFVGKADDFQYLESVPALLESAAGTIDWPRVYRVTEFAQRTREPEPVAEVREWINLHAYGDVSFEGLAQDDARWKTFGGIPKAEPGVALGAQPEAPPENIGWMLASPMLALSEGARQITLTLGFAAADFDPEKIAPLFAEGFEPGAQASGPFSIEVSGADAWFLPELLRVEIGDYRTLSGTQEGEADTRALRFTLRFSEQAEPIAAGDTTPGAWPALRMRLRQIWDARTRFFRTRYAPFEYLRLTHTHLRVDVGGTAGSGPGLRMLVLSSDQGDIDPAKPFEPFGRRPAVGSRLYMGHRELMHKRIERLTFNVEWMGAPPDLAAHYANYGPGDSSWVFQTAIYLQDDRTRLNLGRQNLFAADATQPHSIPIGDLAAAVEKARPGHRYARSLQSQDSRALREWPRVWCWELGPLDFQHHSYPAIAARAAVNMSSTLAADQEADVSGFVINPPYTPQLKELTVDYTSSITIDLTAPMPKDDADQILHLHPFGFSRVAHGSELGTAFLPAYANEGELYLGISGAEAEQTVSVLFQMADGSGDPDLELAPISWSYLSGDRWVDLGDRLKRDKTRGFINSGIIEFELPAYEPHTLFPGGHHWLRASIGRNSGSVCDTVAVRAQAVSATFVDNANAAAHYERPLPPNSVTGFSPRLPSVAGISQPFTSFDGNGAEPDEVLYTRVSERLRHKARALTVWDYEHLVLEQFPQVYKAKCIPADVSAGGGAGELKVVVIPDLRERLPFEPFEPKAPANVLADVKTFLQARAPSYVQIQAINAFYIPVKVRVGVRFNPDYDVSFYTTRLIGDLNRHLSPWAYEEGADIVIGGRIYANSIVEFLDRLEYVDFVAEIKLFKSMNGGVDFEMATTEQDSYFIDVERQDGVLVAARDHEVDVISRDDFDEELFTGINYMKVELDFVVAPDPDSAPIE